MDDFNAQVQCEERYDHDPAEDLRGLRIAELEEEIQAAKRRRWEDEMSDDYCYSNGKYARHTAHINQLEAQLRKLRG